MDSIEYTKEAFKLKSDKFIIEFDKGDMSHIENLWGDLLHYSNEIPEGIFLTGDDEWSEHKPKLFMDFVITVDLEHMKYDCLQDMYKSKQQLNLYWKRVVNSDSGLDSTITYISKEARIANLTQVFSGHDKVKVKIRLIVSNVKVHYINITKKLSELFYLDWLPISKHKYDYVFKVYLSYILSYKNGNINEKELISVAENFTGLNLFSRVSHVMDDKMVNVTLTQGKLNHSFIYDF